MWIHPLIRSVFKNELKPTNADCEQFLSNLWQRLDDRYPQDKKLFKQAAKLFENAAKNLGDKTGDHYFHAGFCHLIGDNFFVALTMEEKAISFREAAHDKDALLLVRNYNDTRVAACYVHHSGNRENGARSQGRSLLRLQHFAAEKNLETVSEVGYGFRQRGYLGIQERLLQ